MTSPGAALPSPAGRSAPSGDARDEGRDDGRLAAVTALWLLLAGELDRLGDAVVPDAWKRHVALQTFLMACQVTAAAAGLGLSFGFLRRPRAALALRVPSLRSLLGAALVAPAVFVAATAVAIQVALPTLLAEAETRGPHASRENAGAFGRALSGSPLLPTLLWSVVLAAVTEELLFRGALFSLLERIFGRVAARAGGQRGVGLAAAVGAAVVFALMHHDVPGGVGLVRVVSTLCLGLACGVARQAAGSVALPIAIHLVHNTLAVGQSRGWFAGDARPLFETVPLASSILGLAAAGLAGLGVVAVTAAVARRRAEQARALDLETPGE